MKVGDLVRNTIDGVGLIIGIASEYDGDTWFKILWMDGTRSTLNRRLLEKDQ